MRSADIAQLLPPRVWSSNAIPVVQKRRRGWRVGQRHDSNECVPEPLLIFNSRLGVLALHVQCKGAPPHMQLAVFVGVSICSCFSRVLPEHHPVLQSQHEMPWYLPYRSVFESNVANLGTEGGFVLDQSNLDHMLPPSLPPVPLFLCPDAARLCAASAVSMVSAALPRYASDFAVLFGGVSRRFLLRFLCIWGSR